MLFTVIKKNSYQDSINLMLLTKLLSSMDHVNRISIMMGTPANKDIFANSNFYTEKLDEAGPNDICIVIDSEEESIVPKVVEEVDKFLKDQSVQSKRDKIPVSMSWDRSMSKLPDANLALISISGEYAAEEANNGLDRGLNIFIFSDNVSIEEEKKLKEKARDKNLLVMGPDCGTGIIQGVPLAFANVIDKGNIGIIGASGTGIQEVSSIISRKGAGISHAIGIGGRDLSSEIGGITAISALELLSNDIDTEVIVFISKPPAEEVRDKIIDIFKTIDKPIVAIFIGEKPLKSEENIYYVWTLEEAAIKAIELSKRLVQRLVPNIDILVKSNKQKGIKGLYSGGTLAAEAAMIIEDRLNIQHQKNHDKGIMLKYNEHLIVDLGDDEYTKGKPHPMMDPTIRLEMMKNICKEEDTAVVLLDFVIGYGGHEDIVGEFIPVIKEIKKGLEEKQGEIVFIASVTGTMADPQIYHDQVSKLESSGVIVMESNAQGAILATEIIKYINGNDKTTMSTKQNTSLLTEELKVINIGLKHFAEPMVRYGAEVVHYKWKPIAGGNKYLASILSKLK
ncbi:acyl-CoA synthetase FdrA [Tissierella praeacuta]|uniref:acyl-CoA synthetase FdrA n=1 Tax=Tissierella praeacuta TaxID=43131 RepID=UPI00289E134F|nr:acyl-CoA synthetase FdrA [Tissierella praeacuta]